MSEYKRKLSLTPWERNRRTNQQSEYNQSSELISGQLSSKEPSIQQTRFYEAPSQEGDHNFYSNLSEPSLYNDAFLRELRKEQELRDLLIRQSNLKLRINNNPY